MESFEEYIRQGEPNKVEKTHIWQTAIGLQQVDGLKPSAYLIETAKLNIEGDITFDQVKSRIDTYYKTQSNRQTDADDRTEEADKVSARIAEILSEKTFSFSPTEYIGIHRRLFSGTYKFAGKIRDYNITKSEWVLNGATVFYSSAPLIRETLEYDFRQEKDFEYKGLTKHEQVEHVAKFISGLWQIHAFGEGNTRTTAVFAIKYLRTFGFDVENEMFAANSWYFRNALVRANYNDHANNIYATMEYLNRFFDNLLFGANNVLKNREMHIKFDKNGTVNPQNDTVNGTVNIENGTVNPQNDTVNGTVNIENDTVFSVIKENNHITTVELSEKLGLSLRTVKRKIKMLKDSGLIERIGSDKTGYWKIKQ